VPIVVVKALPMEVPITMFKPKSATVKSLAILLYLIFIILVFTFYELYPATFGMAGYIGLILFYGIFLYPVAWAVISLALSLYSLFQEWKQHPQAIYRTRKLP